MELSNVNTTDVFIYGSSTLVALITVYLLGRWVLSRFPESAQEVQAAASVVSAVAADAGGSETIKVPPPPGYEYESKDSPCVVCGALATLPAPILQVRRRYLFRDSSHYATTPTYRRSVPRKLPWRTVFNEYCATCAPAADALVDRFVVEDIRASTARQNEELALKVASFMREGLVARLKGEFARIRNQTTTSAAPSRLPLRAVLPSTPEKATGTE